MTSSPPPSETATFEQSLARLEKLVEEMEAGELSLDQMIAHFEEGSKLAEQCGKKLNEVERRIEKLVKKDGTIQPEPFESDSPSS